MKTFKLLLVGGGVVLMVAGCAPEEQSLCEHMLEVYQGDPETPGYLSDLDACVEHYQDQKKRRGVNSYRREAECILGVDTVYNIRTCLKKENKRQ